MADIIGFCGEKGSGKSYGTKIAFWILRENGLNPVVKSFAHPLKEACRIMFLFSHEQLYGDDEIKNKVDPRWGFSPREAMQKLGTEYARNMLNMDAWLIRMGLEIENIDNRQPNAVILIEDCRFLNESAWIRKTMGGQVIGVRSSKGSSGDSHQSERELRVNFEAMTDFRINNNYTKDFQLEICHALNEAGFPVEMPGAKSK